MKLLLNMLISYLKSPFKLLRWLFKHHPVITLIELSALSAVNVFFIFPILAFFKGNGYLVDGLSIGLGTFLGVLAVILASHFRISESSFEVNNYDFEVNNYDVLALSLRDYLKSRGFGIFASYFFSVCLAFILLIPFSLAVVFYFAVIE